MAHPPQFDDLMNLQAYANGEGMGANQGHHQYQIHSLLLLE